MELNPPLTQECPENQRPKLGAPARPETYVPLCTRTEDTFSW